MAFNLSGTTITQTGIDTDLSGLNGISSVTISQQAGMSVYNVGNRRFVISGTLTIDPEQETLLIGYNSGDLVQVTNGAELIIGRAISQNEFTRYSEGLAIYLDNSGAGFVNRFTFQNGANLTWNGGIISMQAGKFGFYGDNCTIRINSLNAKLVYRTQDSENQIRQETDDFISTAFDFINGDFTIVGTGQQLNGYRTTHCSGALAFSGATPNIDVLIRDYAGGGRGNNADVKFWGGCRPVLINSASGTELNAGAHITTNNSSYGILRVMQELSLSVVEFGSGAIEGAKVWFQDYNNGQRRIYDAEAPNIDTTATLTYTETSDVNGNFPKIDVLTGVVAGDTSESGITTVNEGRFRWDYRSKNNDTDDLFDLRVASYNHSTLSLSDISLKGTGGTSVNATMFVDDVITEDSKTTVDAYTELETPQKFYDRAKSYLVDNYAGETALIASRLGSEIDAGSYNVVIDATATTAFAFDGTTITIKATTFTGNIKTNGTVTTANEATIDGTYIDSTQNTVVTFEGVDSWEIFTTEGDRSANTNLLASGLESWGFVYAGVQTTYYSKLTISGEVISKNFTINDTGNHMISLSQIGLLNSINNKIATKEEVYEYFIHDNNEELFKENIPHSKLN